MKTGLRMLIVEDSEDDALLVLHLMRKGGYETTYRRVETAAEMKAALEDETWDIILSDYKLPHFDGKEALALLKESGIDIPFIVISGTIGEDVAVGMMKAGAHDYIMKSKLQRLLPAVEREIRESHGRAERRLLEQKQKEAEAEHLSHVRFLESMDQVNRVIQGANDPEPMMSDVLSAVLRIFDCDRAWLFFPCDPDAPSFRVPMEIVRPGYPGAKALNVDVPMPPDMALNLAEALESADPVTYTVGTERPVNKVSAEQFGVQSMMMVALHPKSGKPWAFGLHQCSFPRIWTIEEKRLLQEIGRRLADGLTSLHAYRDLQESEDRYRRITEGLTDYQYSVRVENGLAVETRQSPACTTVTGYTPEEFAADPSLWIRMVAPEDRGLVQERVRQLLAGSDIPPLEHRIIRRDGQVRWVCDTTILQKDEAGRLASYDGVIKDVTERRESEEQLRKLSLAVEQSPVSIIMTNAAGEIEYVNPRFTSATGYTMNEVQGKNPRILMSGDNALEASQGLRDAMRAGREWRGEFPNTKKNGDLIWQSVLVSPVRDQKGATTHFIAIMEDITEGKRAEQELKQNESRRRELERELIQSQKLESLGTLASGIAHDFNNILAIIAGQSSLLRTTMADPAKLLHRVEAIDKASGRGASLVRQLLTFARKSKAVFESVSISHIISEVINLLHETLPKTITVTTDLKEGIPSIIADASQLHQVLLNLCVNARDAMPTGGSIAITTTTAGYEEVSSRFPRATAREYVCVTVSDTGVGMDEETKQRIFDPFFTTKGPGKGTGLGLALVHSIMESHHGLIAAESAPGRGTTFSLCFPVEERAVESPRSTAEPAADIPGGTETILVIEDEEMLMEMVREILVAKGYRVLSARDGEEGLAAYATHQKEIAVVVSDLGLPKFGGDEIFKRIRAMDPRARVIIASGFMDPEMKEELKGTGARWFIQKPYSPSEALRTIRTAIDNSE